MKLYYLSAMLIGVLSVTVGVMRVTAANSDDALCLAAGNQLLDVQAGQIALAPEAIYAQKLGITIVGIRTAPTLHDTVIVYRQDQEHYGIALLANNLNWIDIQSNMHIIPGIAWSPDGRYFSYTNDTTRAVIYDMQTHQATSIAGSWDLTWPFKGNYLDLKTLTSDITEKIWSAHDARFVATVAGPDAFIDGVLVPANSVTYVTRTPDNKTAVHFVRLDTQTDIELLHLDSSFSERSDLPILSVSVDGSYLSASFLEKTEVFAIDGRLLQTFPAPSSLLPQPAWVGNRLLLWTGVVPSLKTYDPASGKIYELGAVTDFKQNASSGDEIAYKQVTDQGVYVWVVRTDGTHRVRSDTLLPAEAEYGWLGHHITIQNSAPQDAAAWMDVDTGHIYHAIRDPNDLNHNNLELGNGRNATLVSNISTLPNPEFLYLLNLDQNTLRTLLISDNNYQIAWSPDGSLVAIFSAINGGVTVFDTEGRKRGFISGMEFSPVWRSCGS